MWISREELERLKDRVAILERRPTQEKFTVYDPTQAHAVLHYGYMSSIDKQEIPVQTVVQRILDKLGMRLEYVKGQPARIEVADKPLPPDAAGDVKGQ